MLNQQKLNNDLEYGFDEEKKILPILNKFFKLNMETRHRKAPLDFIDRKNKVVAELKARHHSFDTFPSWMIGMNKMDCAFEWIRKGYIFYFINTYENGDIYFYELKNKNHFDEKWEHMGGRTDRGKDEKYLYAYIPSIHFKRILYNKNELFIK
jgi:hypothetical protein